MTPATSPSVPCRPVERAACCVVGGGPAGAVLALLLARRGVPVTLLEAHGDFDRDFRGDTLHPAVMEVLADLGLAERVLGLPHAKVERFVVEAGPHRAVFAEFRRLRTRFPYIVMLPQASLLELLVAEAGRYPGFALRLGARVEAVLEEEGPAGVVVRGVRYRDPGGEGEVRALLTVGADGRFSKLRALAGLEDAAPRVRAGAMDVLWFRLPREPGDPEGAGATFRFGPRGLLVLMSHLDGWQVGLILKKRGFPRLRAAGLGALHEAVAGLAPEFAERAACLVDWRQTSLLSVESSCLPRWHRPGLLLLGDAAHVVSPVGGVGINLAVQDAVAAARRLAGPLGRGQLGPADLAAVERERRGVQPSSSRPARAGPSAGWLPRPSSGGPPGCRPGCASPLGVPAVRRLLGGLIAYGARPARARRLAGRFLREEPGGRT
jgi:2-polyprenyl-6-methoxyphenol hydroxylase-like FAD-dependent oxidoreductase